MPRIREYTVSDSFRTMRINGKDSIHAAISFVRRLLKTGESTGLVIYIDSATRPSGIEGEVWYFASQIFESRGNIIPYYLIRQLTEPGSPSQNFGEPENHNSIPEVQNPKKEGPPKRYTGSSYYTRKIRSRVAKIRNERKIKQRELKKQSEKTKPEKRKYKQSKEEERKRKQRHEEFLRRWEQKRKQIIEKKKREEEQRKQKEEEQRKRRELEAQKKKESNGDFEVQFPDPEVHTGIPLGEPTHFQPGSLEKVEILRQRYEDGVDLWHPDDEILPLLQQQRRFDAEKGPVHEFSDSQT